MPTLFEISAYSYVEQLLQRAVDDVYALAPNILSDPALAGHLDRIAAKYVPNFLELEAPSHADKSQRVVERDDYGFNNTVVIKYLAVSIPFRGDAKLLRVSPSNCLIPDLPFEVSGNFFVVTIIDDQNAATRVERFCSSMRENFRVMKLDFEKFLPKLGSELAQAAQRRLKDIQADTERHSKLPFPVRG